MDWTADRIEVGDWLPEQEIDLKGEYGDDFKLRRESMKDGSVKLSGALSGGYHAPTVRLRPHQAEAVDRVYEEWDAGRKSTLVVHPTGTGKTYVFCGAIRRYEEHYGPRPDGSPRRFMIIAERDYLLNQAAQTLVKFGMDCAIEKAGAKARSSLFGDPQVVIASAQSMQSTSTRDRLLSWEPDYVDALLFDEAHHVLSTTNKRIINHFNWRHLLGVTATAERADGRKLSEVFDSVAHEYTLAQAMEDGRVCRLKIAWCDVNVDISDLKQSASSKDFNDADLDAKIRPHITPIAREIKKVGGSRQMIVFCPSVKVSEFLASALTSLGIPTEHLDAKSKNRDAVISSYRNGDYQCLTNYGLFTEGFDVPSVGAVVMLRPTTSWGLYYQMVGRGLRPTGDHLLVIDFPWVSGNHSLIRPVDIFRGRNRNPEEIRREEEIFRHAERLIDIGAVEDIYEGVKVSREEYRERTRYKLEIKDGPVKAREIVYDPFSSVDVANLPVQPADTDPGNVLLATLNQVRYLERNGFAGAAAMERHRASGIIGRLKKQERAGIAPYWMRTKLVGMGYDRHEVRTLKTEEARKLLGGAASLAPRVDLFD